MPRPAMKAVADDEPEPASPARVVSVDFEAHTYRFDVETVTIDALEDFENQRYIRAIRSILGPEQWAEYKRRNPPAVNLNRFVDALLAAAGSLGNSSASPAS